SAKGVDVNGTRFHLLLGKADWGRSTDGRGVALDKIFAVAPLGCNEDQPGFDWNDDGAEVSLRSCLFEFQPAPLDRRVTPADRRGAARDRYGSFYWIADSAREIRVSSAGTGTTSVFWPVPTKQLCGSRERFGAFGPAAPRTAIAPLALRALAVTDDHYLVVGVIDPGGLLIFDLHAGGPPRHVCWPQSVPFSPWDMAARRGGGVWVLDRQNRRYWALDRHLHVVADEQLEAVSKSGAADDFQPVDRGQTRQSAGRTFPEGIELSVASPIAASDPLSIESLPDGTVLILDRNPDAPFSLIHRYRFGQE